jgi:predicted nucleic acid-binding protein
MTVVVNSTPLIYLAAIGKFDLLHHLYGRVIIPQAVFFEVVTQGANRWGAAETAAANWIEQRAVSDTSKVTALQRHLHGGESEVIVLADELRADLVLMDETADRAELARRGIPFIGTVGVLMQAKPHGLIAALQPELDQLCVCGFHISDRIYRACLAAVAE